MKNLKTTIGGFAAGVAAVAAGIKQLADGDVAGGATSIVTGLGLVWALWHAQDAKKDQ
jgi:X-X-X-Leu-X-X-Gly heptad repeat protein